MDGTRVKKDPKAPCTVHFHNKQRGRDTGGVSEHRDRIRCSVVARLNRAVDADVVRLQEWTQIFQGAVLKAGENRMGCENRVALASSVHLEPNPSWGVATL